jgi:hypothetical protein
MPTKLMMIPTSTIPSRAVVLELMPTLIAANKKPANVTISPTKPILSSSIERGVRTQLRAASKTPNLHECRVRNVRLFGWLRETGHSPK